MKKIFTLLFTILISNTYAQQNLLYPFSPDGKKWGVCNDSLKIIVEPIYEREFFLLESNDYTYVHQNKKTGVMNNNGKILIPCIYDSINDDEIAIGEIARIFMNRKVGIINLKTSKILIPLIYDEINHNSGGVFAVRKNNKWGFVNINTNKLIGKIEFDAIENTNNSETVSVVIRNSKKGLVNLKTGKTILNTNYNKIDIYYIYKTRKNFYIAENSNTKIACDDNGIILKKSISYLKNNFDIETDDRIREISEEGVMRQNNPNENLRINKIKDQAWSLTIEKNKNDIVETFLIDGYDSIIRFSKYDNNITNLITPYKKNIVYAVKDNKVGIIDLSNSVLVPCVYDSIKYGLLIRSYLVKQNGLWGFVSEISNKVIAKPFALQLNVNAYFHGAIKSILPTGQIGYVDINTGKVYIPGFAL